MTVEMSHSFTCAGKAGVVFYSQESGEKFYIPPSSNSSMDSESLFINAVLTSCITKFLKSIFILTDSISAFSLYLPTMHLEWWNMKCSWKHYKPVEEKLFCSGSYPTVE